MCETATTEKNGFGLGINNPMLERCVTDIDQMLNRTAFTMKEKNTNEATVTVKLVLSLEDVDGMSKISVKHDVSAVMQLKQKKSGASEGEYILAYNEETGEFELKPIKDAQMSFDDVVLADAAEAQVFDDDSNEHEETSQKRIGTGIALLPTAEDVAEAAENEIDEDEDDDYEYEDPDEDDEEEDE